MSAVEWGKNYIQYTTAFPMADWLFKEEKENNPRFNELLMVSLLSPFLKLYFSLSPSCRRLIFALLRVQ
jgi:hypothetical protein